MSALSYFNEPAPLAWDVAAAIFGAADTEGGLYDPSALDTIFQDANGTTPAVPGSPVGLVLDARQEFVPVEFSAPTNGTAYPFSTFSLSGKNIVRAANDEPGFAGAGIRLARQFPQGAILRLSFDIEVNSENIPPRLVMIDGNPTGSGIRRSNTVRSVVGSNVIHLIINNVAGSDLLQVGGDSEKYDFGLHNLRIEELSGVHLSQPTTAARPILARMPLTGRRNLLTWTEDFSNSVWLKNNVTTELSPDATFPTAQKISATSASGHHTLTQAAGSGQSLRYCAVKAVTGRYIGIDVTTANIDNTSTTAVFDTQTGSYVDGLSVLEPSANERGALPIINLGDGWWGIGAFRQGNYAFKLRIMNGPSVTDNSVFIGSGESFLVAEPQVTADIFVRVPYQRVTSAYDVTEAGVPDTYSLVYDLADDALTTTLPQDISGDILIAGTKGSIIEPVNYAAGSTFTLGPDTYTGGTPGIMRAIGNVVGVLLIDRELTQNERDNLIQYYKGKGAKGLLVPGPELVTDPNDVDSYSFLAGSSGSLTYEDGWVKLTRGSGTTAAYVTLPSGAYISKSRVRPGTANPNFRIGSTPAGSNLHSATYSTEVETEAVATLSPPSNISFGVAVTGTVEGSTVFFKDFSVRELRPQEDWT